jgi:hypothetical protein
MAASVNMVSGYHFLYYVDREGILAPTTAVYIGSTGPEGIRQTVSKSYQEIKGDATGPETTVDTVAQGGNCNIEFVLQELNLARVNLFLAPARITTTPGAIPAHNEVGLLGHLGSSFSGILYAVPKLASPAALAHGGSLTVRKYYGHVVGDIPETLDPTTNVVPVRFLCLPFSDGANLVWWDWLSVGSLSLT